METFYVADCCSPVALMIPFALPHSNSLSRSLLASSSECLLTFPREEKGKVLDSGGKGGETNERSERIRTLLIYASLIHANISSSVLLGARAASLVPHSLFLLVIALINGLHIIQWLNARKTSLRPRIIVHGIILCAEKKTLTASNTKTLE